MTERSRTLKLPHFVKNEIQRDYDKPDEAVFTTGLIILVVSYLIKKLVYALWPRPTEPEELQEDTPT
jgi:hypothetical protein